MDNKYRQLEEIGHAEGVSFVNGIVWKMVVQNAGETALLYHQELICSWSQIDPSNLLPNPVWFALKVAWGYTH